MGLFTLVTNYRVVAIIIAVVLIAVAIDVTNILYSFIRRRL